MSATPLPVETSPDHSGSQPGSGRPRLGLVPPTDARLGNRGFVIFLASLLVAGVIGLLLLNTFLQTQAIDADKLRQQAAAMSYREGELVTQVTEASSTGELTRKASKMGMRPNDNIAYVDVRTGEITGKAEPADGQARPASVVLTDEEEAATSQTAAEDYAESRRTEAQEALAAARERAEAAQPAPVAPAPQDPAPQDPAAQDPAAQDPAQDPAAQNPAQDPAAQQPAAPAPEQPGPEQPAPAQPAPAQPQPAQGAEEQATEMNREGN